MLQHLRKPLFSTLCARGRHQVLLRQNQPRVGARPHSNGKRHPSEVAKSWLHRQTRPSPNRGGNTTRGDLLTRHREHDTRWSGITGETSEEHTSELQSPFTRVSPLLPPKPKHTHIPH